MIYVHSIRINRIRVYHFPMNRYHECFCIGNEWHSHSLRFGVFWVWGWRCSLLLMEDEVSNSYRWECHCCHIEGIGFPCGMTMLRMCRLCILRMLRYKTRRCFQVGYIEWWKGCLQLYWIRCLRNLRILRTRGFNEKFLLF